jgi:hypothetical protein
VQTGVVFVLTVLHAQLDIPECLAELQPTLKLEVALLHQRLVGGTKETP